MDEKNIKTKDHHTRLKDILQIIIGAGALAFPVSLSEDTWAIAKRLGLGNILGIAIASVLIISAFV